MENKLTGYILIFVCLILGISVCVISNDILLIHLELGIINTEESYPTKLYNARFLYAVSPDSLDDYADWKNAVVDNIDSEKSGIQPSLKQEREFLIRDKKEFKKEQTFPFEKENKYLIIYILLAILFGIHLVARFITTQGLNVIQQVHISPVLTAGFGISTVFMFLMVEILGFLGFLDPLMFYLGPFAGNAILLLLISKYMKSKGSSVLYEAGFLTGGKGKAFISGIAGFFAFLPFQVILNSQGMHLSYFLGFLPDGHPFVRDFIDTQSVSIQFVIAFLVLFSAPFFEEIFFRGIFLQSLEQRFHPAVACIVSGLIFGIIHPGFISRFLVSFLGIYLAFLMQKTRSIITPIMVHFMFNANALLQLLIK